MQYIHSKSGVGGGGWGVGWGGWGWGWGGGGVGWGGVGVGWPFTPDLHIIF